MSVASRIILLLTALVAAYEVVAGIENYSQLTIIYFTLGFGIILLSALLILLMGYDILENPVVSVIATVLPVSFALGLVNEYLPDWHTLIFGLTAAGILLMIILKYSRQSRWSVFILIPLHGLSGLIIFVLPFYLAITGYKNLWFMLVGIGGLSMGLIGLLLTMLKLGKPVLTKEKILFLFPFILLFSTFLFGLGLNFGM
ncbi:MAG TPA: hypothetical protein ENK44_00765 [Caldithrix abyssi]|uniref:Uncharacterized protein n=1 Tax=Caldithrix abyssi TaxID=187145 RepID=A0A7V4TYW6_CALAY|nr:hypothetical protein [Caldithrix abyssi]